MKKHYYIIFDTNVIWGKPVQKNFLELKKYIDSSGLEVGLYVPDTVKEEFKKKTLFEFKDVLEKYNSAINTLSKFEYLKTHKLKSIDIDEIAIKKKLEKILHDNGLEVLEVPYSKIDFKKILEKATYYYPPFEKNEKGFKDSVIAETIFSAVENFDKSGTKIFVCNDNNLRTFVESQNKNLLVYGSINEALSRIKGDEEEIGDIDNLVNEADEMFYIQIRDVDFFNESIDVIDFLHKKFPEETGGYTVAYSTTGDVSQFEKYLSKLSSMDDEEVVIKGRPFYLKKEDDWFFWENKINLSKTFLLRLSDSPNVYEVVRYNLFFTVHWKALLVGSHFESPELMEVKYTTSSVEHDIGRFFPEISNFNIYPSEVNRFETTYS